MDKSGAVEKPATWNVWGNLFDCVTKLRHGSEEQRDEARDSLGVEPVDVPHWLQPVDLYANELAAKMKRRTAPRVLGKIRENMRSYFDTNMFDMKRLPTRATRQKH